MAVRVVPNQPQVGGLEYEFDEEIPEKYICSNFCSKVLRDPYLTGCCGKHFCESCLQDWLRKQEKEKCPHCETENFKHILDIPLKREIDGFRIHCTNHKEGCSWVGTASALDTHLDECDYAEIGCINGCKKRLKRKDLPSHLNLYCPLRKYKCQYCGKEDTYQAINSEHYGECPNYPLSCPNRCGMRKFKRAELDHHRSKCPLEPVECPFKEGGCKAKLVRKEYDTHQTASIQQHLLLAMTQAKETKAELHILKTGVSKVVDHLLQSCTPPQEAQLQSIKALVSGSRLRKLGDAIGFTISNVEQYIQKGEFWHSPPFYYKEGYRMRLDVSLLRRKQKHSFTHMVVSCSLHLLKGELDDELDWPVSHNDTVIIGNDSTAYFSINSKLELFPVQNERETLQIGTISSTELLVKPDGDVFVAIKLNSPKQISSHSQVYCKQI